MGTQEQSGTGSRDFVKDYLSSAAAQAFQTEDLFGILMGDVHQTVGPAWTRRLALEALAYFELLAEAMSPTGRSEFAKAQALVAPSLRSASG